MYLDLTDTLHQLVALPTRELHAYATINSMLYGEPGFSDLTPNDLCKKLLMEPDQLGAILTTLRDAALIYWCMEDVNGYPYIFIYSNAHNHGWVKDGMVVGPHPVEFKSADSVKCDTCRNDQNDCTCQPETSYGLEY